jgi:hypothetical protein
MTWPSVSDAVRLEYKSPASRKASRLLERRLRAVDGSDTFLFKEPDPSVTAA